MKIAHVPLSFYPDRGGSESYVGALASHLQNRGLRVIIIAPGKRDEVYEYNRLKVYRIFIPPFKGHLEDLYMDMSDQVISKFARILDIEQPDLMHLHIRLREISAGFLREVKRRTIPTVFTYHTPSISCLRGDLMRWGKQICKGDLDESICTRCFLKNLGLNRGWSEVLGRTPKVVGKMLGRTRLSGSLWTALRMRELVYSHHAVVRNFFREIDHFVVLSKWTQDLLIRNGVPTDKITLSRLGLCQELGQKKTSHFKHKHSSNYLRCVFVGRFDSTKGLDVLIRAIRSDLTLPVRLDLYGVALSDQNKLYLKSLERFAGNDARILFRGPLPDQDVVTRLQEYDLLAVPSKFVETGPFVILEAFAAGIPVLGSSCGGIAELVEHEVNGLLVETGSVNAWYLTLKKLCRNRDLLTQLQSGIRPPRLMSEVAEEMITLYTSLCNSSRSENS